jgi:nicotinamide mononucleotide transporter
MYIITNYLITNWLEIFGIITTIICVWLNIKQNIWGWIWAILASFVYGIVYFQSKLYSDMELQGVFIVISFYGWWQWYYGTNENEKLPVSKTPKKFYIFLLILFIAFTAISGYFHGKYTDASFPYFDSSLTAISLIAQYLLAKKYIENWLLWIIANIGYVAMYYSKNLFGTSVLYFVLFIMAIKGFLDWKANLVLKVNNDNKLNIFH